MYKIPVMFPHRQVTWEWEEPQTVGRTVTFQIQVSSEMYYIPSLINNSLRYKVFFKPKVTG